MKSTSRAVPALLAALVLAIVAPGCGSGPAEHDGRTAYTPEALAEELAFRAKPVISKRRSPEAAKKKGAVAAPEDAVRGAEEVGKKDLSQLTLDDVVADVLAKARTIPGASFEATRGKIVEALRADATLNESEKATVIKAVEASDGT